MPIPPERRKLYPSDWPAISRRIRFVRAGGRCEQLLDNGERCPARHGRLSPLTGSLVVLTVGHLDQDPTHNEDGNLRAFCQLHHLAWDRPYNLAKYRRTIRRRLAVADLFEEERCPR